MTKMKLSGLIATIAAVLTIQAQAAQESDPVGYYRTVIPGNSDGILSVPVSDDVSFQGAVNGVAGNSISVAGTPFSAGAFTNGLSYVRFANGVNVGLWATITNNTANTLFLRSTEPADVAVIAVGDRFAIAPHATLATVFPDADVNVSFVATPTTSIATRKTELLVLDLTGQKANRSASATYYYLTNGFWRSTGSAANADNTVLPPQRFFILRNRNNTGELTYRGVSSPYPWALATGSLAGTNKNDNILSTGRHGILTLDELDLIGAGAFKLSTSTSIGGRGDELQIFNNGSLGFNKSASATYFCLTNANAVSWRSTGATGVDVSHQPVIQAGAGLVIRRAVSATTTNNIWTSAPSY